MRDGKLKLQKVKDGYIANEGNAVIFETTLYDSHNKCTSMLLRKDNFTLILNQMPKSYVFNGLHKTC